MEDVGMNLKNFYKNKKVLITGHTGFKGSWMTFLLHQMEANITGIALQPLTNPALYDILNLEKKIDSRIVDIRKLENILEIFEEVQPDIVIHMAAQPLVIESYLNPVHTYDVNIMGTVNVCEAIRQTNSVRSFINVTTDKVYQNREWCYGYREDDTLNGQDPYSNSKSCSELVTDSFSKSFFFQNNISVSRCRAGNVIGGGDFSENRIIPDCVKYITENQSIQIRNPNSTRPYQHVLEPVVFYLYLAMLQYKDKSYSGTYNIGPNESDCKTTSQIVELFCKTWKEGASWNITNYNGPHEANFLKLDCSKAKKVLNWKPVWDVEMAIQKTVEWSKMFYEKQDMEKISKKQITEYLGELYLWKK